MRRRRTRHRRCDRQKVVGFEKLSRGAKWFKMKLKPKQTIADYFVDLEDPRIERTKRHQLIDIITIAICAVICGADSWVAIETYGQAKKEWLKRFLELPNGIPSHDTFARIFASINPQKFQECFLSWIKSIAVLTDGEVIAIDGKNLKHSYDKKAGNRAISMVSAWAGTNKLVLAQRKVDSKSLGNYCNTRVNKSIRYWWLYCYN